MKRAKIILSVVAVLAICSAIFAFKATRNPAVFYSLNTTTTNPAHRLCTLPTVISYTTVEADKLPGAPTVIQTTFYSSPVNLTFCPTLTIWEQE